MQNWNFYTGTLEMLTWKLKNFLYFDYASSSWYSGLTKKYKSRLQCTQNKIIRFLLNALARTHIGTHEFEQAGMLPVGLRVEQLKLNIMYKIAKKEAPSYLLQSVRPTRDQHTINTRFSNSSFQLPSVNSFGKTSFIYTGISIWNKLPNHLKSSKNLSNFKNLVKKYLFQSLHVQESNPYIYY